MASVSTVWQPRGVAPVRFGGSRTALATPIPAVPGSQSAPRVTMDDVKRWMQEAIDKHNASDLKGAIDAYRRILAVQPRNRVAWGNLGVVYRKAKRPDMAIACYRRALDGDENNAGVIGNLANAYKDQEDFEQSLAYHRRAIELDPKAIGLLHNYGVALSEAGLPVEARRVFDDVVARDPNHIDGHWDRSICALRLGDFSRASWDDYDWRWKLQELNNYVPPTKAPIWRGEKLNGKTLLVYSEQGFGDTLLALRYLPKLVGLDGRVILRCQPELQRLAGDVPGFHEMASSKDPAPPHDLAIPMMSLMGLFTRVVAEIPPPPTLRIPGGAGEKALRLIARAGDRFKVGIIWSGSVTFRGNLRRAVTLDRFLRFADVPGVQLFSLQKGPPHDEYTAADPNPVIVDLGSTFEDFADTAAALRALDLVIMTDSSVAHLAGTLGVPIWDLVNFNTYWIYFLGRDDTAWYPSMRLFRQEKPGDWDEVFARAGRELARHVAEVRRG